MVEAVCSQPEARLFSRPRSSWALLHRQLNGYGAQMHGSLECTNSIQDRSLQQEDGKEKGPQCVVYACCSCRH